MLRRDEEEQTLVIDDLSPGDAESMGRRIIDKLKEGNVIGVFPCKGEVHYFVFDFVPISQSPKGIMEAAFWVGMGICQVLGLKWESGE